MTTNNQRPNPFALPPRSSGATSNGAGYDRKEFKQWVEDLPIGHVGQTARDLHQVLESLGQISSSPIERFEALEMLQPPLQFVLEALTSHYLLDPLPLPKRERLIARLRQELMIKCVVGYKVVLEQFHDESFTGYLLHKHARGEALRRVLFYLGQLVLHSYQLYQETPPYLWREIHGIYHYAVENELHQRDPLHENGASESEDLSVEGLYKQILLLALSGPYQLLKGEVQKVYSALKKWVPAADLLPLEQAANVPGFAVDVLADQPPSQYGSQSREKINKGWLLGTERLGNILETELQAAVSKDADVGTARPIKAASNLSTDLITKLALVWGVGTARRGRRAGMGGEVVMTCGIEAMYGILGGELQPNMTEQRLGFKVAGDDEPLDFQAAKRLEQDEYVIDAGPDLGLQSSVSESEAEIPPESPPVERIADEEPAKICTKICAVIDHSSSGYHLTFAGRGDSRARVGELVGICRTTGGNSKSGDWRLGVIRWLRTQKPTQLSLGVELFGGEIKPISIRRERGGSGLTDYWCGFQEHREAGRATLILPSFYAADGDRLFLAHNGDVQAIRLRQALQRTDSFVQFWFEEAGEMEAAGNGNIDDSFETAEQGQESGSEFESIWRNLH